MKKFLPFLLISLLALFLTACNIQTVEKFEEMQEQERSVVPLSTPEQHEETEKTPPRENETAKENQEMVEPEVKENAPLKEKESEPRQKKVVPQEKKEEKQQLKQVAEKKQEITKTPITKTEQTPKKAVDKPKTNTVTPPTVKEQQPATQKRTVTIAIRVDTLLKHWDLLDPSLQSEKYVPNNGIILKQTTYELLSEKDTVWDVLQRAAKEHKIQMEYQGANENIYNSVYVEGINHLYEFSAGELSGWMYKVNNTYPNYGCSQYVLKDGDVIEWNYTVDLGRDLGNQWNGN